MNINCIFGSHKPLNPGSLGFMQARNAQGDIIFVVELCQRCQALYWRPATPQEVKADHDARVAAQLAAVQAQEAAVNSGKVIPMDHQRKRKPKPPVE